MNRFITLGSMLAFGVAVAACNTPDSSSTVQRDVAKADADRTKDVADARRDGAEAVQRQQTDVNAAARDVTEAQNKPHDEHPISEAEGDSQVSKPG
jgi:hypothetical protein